MTTIPHIAPIPAGPQRGTDTDEIYRGKADAMMARVETLDDDLNAYADAANAVADETEAAAADAEASRVAAEASAIGALSATTYVATSVSSLAATTGAKAVHVAQAGRGFAVDDRLVLIDRADPTVRMAGAVTVSDGSDDYTVDIDEAPDLAGPYANWFVMLEALEPVYWSTAAMVWAAAEARAAVSPKSLKEVGAWVPLTYASTITRSLLDGFKRAVTLTGAPTIAKPDDLFDGAPVCWKFENGAGAGSPTWDSSADFRADGVPTFVAGLGKVHYVWGEYDASRDKIVYNVDYPA
jgi:hypothetical protein